MRKNVGVVDRCIRFVGGIVLLYIGYGFAAGALRWVLLILGVIGVVEGLIGYCGLYRFLNIDTAAREKPKE